MILISSLQILFLLFINVNFSPIEAHIPENAPNVVVKKMDKYKVLFLPYPKEPIKGDNTTLLNLNIVDENGDLKNIYSSVIISNKKNSSIVFQTPFKFYTIGDISLPFSFPDNGDYIVSLLTKINGDRNYERVPIIANFDLKVRSEDSGNFFDSILNIFYKLA
ncbi:MAG: hypothetical protein ACM31J_01215 [Nitrososphaerales archaeon]